MKSPKYLIILIAAFFLAGISACKKTDPKLFEKGVSKELATYRVNQLDSISYKLHFSIPENKHDPIQANALISFISHKKSKIILDFRTDSNQIQSLKINGKKHKYKFKQGHIILPTRKIKQGKNTIHIEFIAGDLSLNRNPEYLYTLFVPDRASTAFPCFDQPDLKARYQLSLQIPAEWTAVSNGKIENENENENSGRKNIFFARTKPISSYLFSFAAGKFQIISRTIEGRAYSFYHREQDKNKVENNTEAIFKLHHNAISWLESYTRIPYPFEKFDFIAIPSFQYSGMEHPGAILYRSSKLFLDAQAGLNEELSRANLISHETAHMWFGDLVTMPWFNEVWLKEVFANFMADKIINPEFPQVDHNINFLTTHYPAAYSIDRTKGANPIQQELDNMLDAGTLYGAIIYHKAPIVMRLLEQRVGEDTLKAAIRNYLSENKYGNASWDVLINHINQVSANDHSSWSNAWVYEAGRPKIIVSPSYNADNKIAALVVEQQDPIKKGRFWPQKMNYTYINMKNRGADYLVLNDTFNVVPHFKEFNPKYILPNSDGNTYGYIELDPIISNSIIDQKTPVKDPLNRCSNYIMFYENMLEGQIGAIRLLHYYLESIHQEDSEQNIQLLLKYIDSIFWKFLSDETRDALVVKVESQLKTAFNETPKPRLKKSLFRSYYQIALTDGAIDELYQIFEQEKAPKGIELSERDYSSLALLLAVHNHPKAIDILKEQKSRIEDPEKKKRFEFISKAAHPNAEIRKKFFQSLQKEKNRTKEPWVVDALYLLHHPLRQKSAISYLEPSLILLEEIKETGDIFFPKQWLDATFSGHRSIEAVTTVNAFLNEQPDYPGNLKMKIWQASDLTFRAVTDVKEKKGQ